MGVHGGAWNNEGARPRRTTPAAWRLKTGRAITAFVVLVTLASPALTFAEVAKPEEPKVTRLTLHPAPEPRPALKYQLLPTRPELESGNAVGHYHVINSTLPLRDENDKKRIHDGLNKPLSELNRDALPADWPAPWVDRLITRASRQLSCDWQLSPHEGIDMVLPSLGELRRTANWITVYARVLIAEGKYEDALRILQASMAMGRHVGQDLTLIQGLVGLSIHANAINRLEDWVQQPRSPNLYWALANLPQPLIHFSTVAQYETRSLELSIPQYLREKIRGESLPQEQAEELLLKFVNYANMIYNPENKIHADLSDFKEVPTWLAQRLIDYGYDHKLVTSLPSAQAHLLYTLDRYRELMDEQIKWYSVPFAQSQQPLAAIVAVIQQRVESNVLLDTLVGGIDRAPRVAARYDRKLTAFRVIEAIRMYAADHGGKLPPTLEAITKVPVPMDPMTGKPFVYALKDGVAKLEAPDFPGAEEGDALRYELTIAR